MLLGIRWDHADSNTLSRTLATGATTTTQLSNDAVTKRGALLYKFDNGIAPYIQYTESFQPQAGVVGFGGTAFVPTTGQQEEAGIKYQPNAKSLYTLAVYNLLQQNVLTPDPNPAHIGFSVPTGEIRSRGIELEGKTEIDRNLSLLASYTYDDAVITRNNVPYEAGRHPVAIPLNSASLWADYRFHSGRSTASAHQAASAISATPPARYRDDRARRAGRDAVRRRRALRFFRARAAVQGLFPPGQRNEPVRQDLCLVVSGQWLLLRLAT
jgi:outer membrane receptor protein involved in Fe transport